MTRLLLLAGALAIIAAPVLAMDHTMVTPDTIKWGPASPSIPKGAEATVISGDPSKEGPFVVRLKFPANYKVAAHTHPADENLTVISGTFHMGMGDKLDESKGEELPAGSFSAMPKDVAHYGWTTVETVLQIHGEGPLAIKYVNPSDDPSKQ